MIPRRHGVVVFVGFSPRRGIPGFAHASRGAGCAREPRLRAGARVEPLRDPVGLRLAGNDRHRRRSGSTGAGGGREQWARSVPLGRLGTAEEVASVIAFLCSPGGGLRDRHDGRRRRRRGRVGSGRAAAAARALTRAELLERCGLRLGRLGERRRTRGARSALRPHGTTRPSRRSPASRTRPPAAGAAARSAASSRGALERSALGNDLGHERRVAAPRRASTRSRRRTSSFARAGAEQADEAVRAARARDDPDRDLRQAEHGGARRRRGSRRRARARARRRRTSRGSPRAVGWGSAANRS